MEAAVGPEHTQTAWKKSHAWEDTTYPPVAQPQGYAEEGQKASLQWSRAAVEKLWLGKEKSFVWRLNYTHDVSFLRNTEEGKVFPLKQ